MKNRRQRAKQVRRRKVAQLAAYSRKYTVNNCTIPKVDEKDIIKKKVKWGTIDAVAGKSEWTIPKNGYTQTKRLRKKYKKKYYCKDGTIRKIVSRISDYNKFLQYEPIRMTQNRYKELLIAHKTAKWIRKHPRPIKQNDKEPDLFEQEFMAPWIEMYNKAVKHIREVVFSKRDKLPLTGRFEEKNATYMEKKVAEIVDEEREGDKINHLDPKKSPLLKKAQKKTNQIKAKHSNLVCTNLRDRKNKKGRIILPQAA